MWCKLQFFKSEFFTRTFKPQTSSKINRIENRNNAHNMYATIHDSRYFEDEGKKVKIQKL